MDDMELSYQGMKDAIKTELNRVAESFVNIGYHLKQVRDGELYKIDGYENINDFAKAEYNLSQSTTSRFISINDKYSVDGSSPKLLEQYEGYGYSKLSEMLTLSEDELKLVTVQTTRAEIREIKQVKKEAEETGIYAPAHNAESLDSTQSKADSEPSGKYIIPEADKLLVEFFREKSRRSILKDLAAVVRESELSAEEISKAAEIINPSGYLFFRKGMIIMTFEEKTIKYSKFGGLNTEFTYSDFLHDVSMVFAMNEEDPAVAFYGEPEPEPVPDPPKKEPEKKQIEKKPDKKVERDKPKEEKKTAAKPVTTQPEGIKQSEEIKTDKPEDKDTENQDVNKTEDNIPGQHEIEEYPEYMPEEKPEPDEQQEENVEIVEADIVEKEKTPEDNKGDIQKIYAIEEFGIYLDKSTGKLSIIITEKNDNSIKSVNVTDSETEKSWEVTIE